MKLKNINKILFTCLIIGINSIMASEPVFKIRGTLPWHNFLSGPSAWDLDDYEKYLDGLQKHNMNFIGFHNYTGGGERYATYVEPMIKIQYKNIVPDAYFDNSNTARWGYTPMMIKDFVFGSDKVFRGFDPDLPFGAECSITSQSKEEHYTRSQKLMQQVVELAHKRKIQVAMGFEFGVHPPEYFSLKADGDFYWMGEGNLIPNPAHFQSIQILYATIDNILETYPSIDYIWLWLNEHSFMGVNINHALGNAPFREIYENNQHFFEETGNNQAARFIGVWSLQYMRLAHNYIMKRKAGTKIILGGWGGGNQLPAIMQGLDRALSRDIIFSLLNPGLGRNPQPAFLKDIAENRPVIAIPWLEGDHQLWHLQPRVNLMREHVKLAAEMELDGVAAIHWRTEETRLNFESFARFANNPADPTTTAQIYKYHINDNYGPEAVDQLGPILTRQDEEQWNPGLSMEYYFYNPGWGRMSDEDLAKFRNLLSKIHKTMSHSEQKRHLNNLNWLKANTEFALLLHEVGVKIDPAYQLMKQFFETDKLNKEKLAEARESFKQAPIQKLFEVYASRVRSKGEMGVLSALNQKLWVQHQEIARFLNAHLK